MLLVLLLVSVPFSFSQLTPAGAPAVASTPAPADTGTPSVMTDSEVQAAIAHGANNKRPIGVHVQAFDTGDVAGTGCRHCGEISFDLTVYNAEQWIEAQAFAANQAKRRLTPDNVPQSMRQAVVYVIAREVRNDLDLTASATDIGFRAIQLAGGDKAAMVEPLVHKFTQQMGDPGSGLTGHVDTATATAIFSVDSVKGLLAKNRGEFDVVLTLSRGQKFLRVKASGASLPL